MAEPHKIIDKLTANDNASSSNYKENLLQTIEDFWYSETDEIPAYSRLNRRYIDDCL